MKNQIRPLMLGAMVIWMLIISASAWWNVSRLAQFQQNVYLEAGRKYFDMVVTMREWNAQTGGVYIPVSETVQPSEYLDVENRDLETTEGLHLTLVNPAFMTRLVAEVVKSENQVQFHITSLNPIRPKNAPYDWEATALNSFEAGEVEYVDWNEQNKAFRYMAPLITSESCLKCHEQQGYAVGDIRGGISIEFPAEPPVLWPIITSHVGIGAFGLAIIFLSGQSLGSAFKEIARQSLVDGLTRIYNRRFFDQTLSREYLRARRNKTPLSVVMIDIDNFKEYNDTYGHQAGDDCLREVAKTLKAFTRRPGDIAARYGGEEFACILPDTYLDGAVTLADIIREGIEQMEIPHEKSEISQYVTISAGVWTYTGEEISIQTILEKTDDALYKAKKSGRNIVMSIP